MDDPKKYMDEISSYMVMNRQAGFTTLLRTGTDNYRSDKFIITENMKQGEMFRCLQSEIVPLSSLERLRGHSRPLVIDNSALIQIFHQASLKLSKQEEEIKTLRKDLDKVKLSDIKHLETQVKYNKIKYSLALKDAMARKKEIKEMRDKPFKTFFKTIFGLWKK
jgi:hypothetical protein